MYTLLNDNGQPIFDVQVDGNHLFDEAKVQLCAYALTMDSAGVTEVDTRQPIFSVTVPSGGFADDVWCQSDEVAADSRDWPAHIRRAFDYVVLSATDLFYAEHGNDPRFKVDDTVFLPEYKMPGKVIALTPYGDYIVDMGGTGQVDLFTQGEVEQYDQELWHRP